MSDKFEHISNSLEISPEFEKLPSEMKNRLNELVELDGQEYQIARDNILDVLKVGSESMVDLQSLAMQTQDARYFRVLNELLQTLISAQRELMEMKKIEHEILSGKEKDMKDITPKNNIIMVSSTAELAKLLENNK